MDGKARDLTELADKHFIFAEEFLMPEVTFKKEHINSREDIDRLAFQYAVSPSAIVMRASRLGMIDNDDTKERYLDDLQKEWNQVIASRGGGNPIGLEKAINRYNNPAVVNLILKTYNSQNLNSEAVKNLLCYKKGDKFSLSTLENYGK